MPMMMSGPVASPPEMVSEVAMITDESGSLRKDTSITAMPTATAGVSDIPGRCEAMIPPAAPR